MIQHKPSRDEIRELLNAAVDIPHSEMPDWMARAALFAAIDADVVIGIYRPIGGLLHNIELRHDLIAGDPRLSAEEWTARVRAQATAQATQGGQAQ